MKKRNVQNIFQWILMPAFLLVFWLIATLFLSSSYSISVLPVSYNANHIVNYRTTELTKGQIITGNFTAQENNLGIVSVRFFNFNRINSDYVIFRIRNSKDNKWYYENKYKVDQFLPNELFTFGFPIISNSKGNTYIFQIESTKGRKGDAVALSSDNPVFVVQYQYTKNTLLSNKSEIPIFLLKKVFYTFTDASSAVSSLLYLVPFVIYLLWLALLKRYTSNRKNLILVYVFIASVLLFSIFMKELNRDVEIMLIGIWVIIIIYYKLENRFSFLLALLFLSITPFLMAFGYETIANNAALWAYLFLVVGTFQSLWELWKKPKGLVLYTELLPKGLVNWKRLLLKMK